MNLLETVCGGVRGDLGTNYTEEYIHIIIVEAPAVEYEILFW